MRADHAADEYREWEALVGHTIVRFGEIEYITIKCLELLPQDRIAATAARMPFAQRVNLVLEILEGRKITSKYVQQLVRHLVRARQLAEKRNLIAHNPVMLEIYSNRDETEARTRYAIASARGGGKPITLEDLKELAAEVDDLAASMWLCFNYEVGTSEHMWRDKSVQDGI